MGFVSSTFAVDQATINHLLKKHTAECTICQGRRIIYDTEGAPIHCTCWHNYQEEFLLYQARIPREYHFKTNADLVPEWRELQDEQVFITLGQYLKRMAEIRDDGLGLYLKGDKGSGTSFVASLLLMHALRKGFSALFLPFRELVDASIRSLRDSELSEDLITIMSEIDFLLLDGVDTAPASKSDLVESILPSLIKRRHYQKLPIIVTATYGPEQLADRTGDQLAAVLTERASLLAFRGNFKKQAVKDLEAKYFHI